MIFKNASGQTFTFQEFHDDAVAFIKQDTEKNYVVMVGSDSQVKSDHINYVNAIVIHRVGKGAKFYYSKTVEPTIPTMMPKDMMFMRIQKETAASIEIMNQLMNTELFMMLPYDNFEIHIDIGPNGKSNEMMTFITGWIKGLDINCKIKPESTTAYCTANKYSK